MRNSGVVGFHGFSKKLSFSGSTVVAKEFIKSVKELLKNGYIFRTLSEFEEYKNCDKSLFYYFDDCDLSTYEVIIKELKETKFVATLFAISDFIDDCGNYDVIYKNRKTMSVEQIKELILMGFELGSHTATHIPLVIEKYKDSWQKEIIESKEKLEKIFDTEAKFLSVPYGNYNKELINFVRKQGYKSVVTINNVLKDTQDGLIVGHPAYNLDNATSIYVKSTNANNFACRVNSFLYNQFSKGSVLLKSF